MRSTSRLIVLCLSAALTGCVSMGKYKTLQGENVKLQTDLGRSNVEAGGLRNDLGTAQDSNVALSLSKTALESQNSDLEQSQANLANHATALEGRNADLERDKAALVKAAQEKQAQYDQLTGDLNQEIKDGLLKITRYKDMLTLDVADQILFDSGKDALKPAGEAVLLKVAKAIAKSAKVIQVVGHTDNVPLAPGAQFASNWELSTARATKVVRFLQDQGGLDPTRLVASGRGQWLPVASNDSPEGRQKNRRIEITLVDPSVVDGSEGVNRAVTAP